MKGDFSRRSAVRDPSKPYTAVLHQQGRVWLDSDWNEDVFEREHQLRQEMTDIIGKCGVPEPGTAFQISPNPNASPNTPGDFLIGGGLGNQGRAYVDGALCELAAPATYLTQPDLPNPTPIAMPSDGSDLNAVIYLEVWQRLITALEDSDIREVALGGPDTATRLKTVAQVKVAIVPNTSPPTVITLANASQFLPLPDGSTLTTIQPQTQPSDVTDLCRLPDPANFTGRENRLYRVEIHEGGDVIGGKAAPTLSVKLSQDVAAGTITLPLAQSLTSGQIDAVMRWGLLVLTDDGGNSERVFVGSVSDSGLVVTLAQGLQNAYQAVKNARLSGAARFKWSRDNASFAVNVVAVAADRRTLTLSSLGRDQATALRQGDLVEIADDASELGPARGHLTNLTSDPDPDQLTVVIADPLPASFQLPGAQTGPQGSPPSSPPTSSSPDRHLLLRRWDGTGMAQAAFVLNQTLDMDLGEGVQIQFGGADLLPGDYWQFAARSADGTVEQLANAPPTGVIRHRCPLAIVRWSRQSPGSPPGSPPQTGYQMIVLEDCRQIFPALVDSPRTEAGLHIEQLSVGDTASGQSVPLINDTTVLVPQLIGGINVLCDGPIDPASIGRATCFVILEIPFTMSMPGSPPATELAGYQQLLLAGNASANGDTISWRPTTDVATALPNLALLIPQNDRGLLTRLILKGNFIWSQNTQLFLDGEAYGRPQSGFITLNLPSGDKRRGGDFEMWFWLVGQPVTLANIQLAPSLAFVGDPVTGTLSISGPAPQGFQILPTSDTPSVATVSGPAQFAPGSTQAAFAVAVLQQGAATISAAFGGVTLKATLTAAARQATIAALTLPGQILLGASATGSITLSSGAAAGSSITLTATPPGIVSFTPATIQLAGGATSATFAVQGTAIGQALVVATFGGSSASRTISVGAKFKDKDKDKDKDHKDKDKDSKDKDKEKDHKELEKTRDAVLMASSSPSGVNGAATSHLLLEAKGKDLDTADQRATVRAFIHADERPTLAGPQPRQPDA